MHVMSEWKEAHYLHYVLRNAVTISVILPGTFKTTIITTN